MNVEGLEAVKQALRERLEAAVAQDGHGAIVGYTAPYAVYVHENMEQKLKGQPRRSGLGVYWGPQGGPKFLEGPARELAAEVSGIIVKAMQGGATLAQAIVMGCYRIMRESMLRVPVEYGDLKRSAFVSEE